MSEEELNSIRKNFKLASKFNGDFNTENDNQIFDYIKQSQEVINTYEILNIEDKWVLSENNWKQLQEWLTEMIEYMKNHSIEREHAFLQVLEKVKKIKKENER